MMIRKYGLVEQGSVRSGKIQNGVKPNNRNINRAEISLRQRGIACQELLILPKP